jgi:hypothetical protein
MGAHAQATHVPRERLVHCRRILLTASQAIVVCPTAIDIAASQHPAIDIVPIDRLEIRIAIVSIQLTTATLGKRQWRICGRG